MHFRRKLIFPALSLLLSFPFLIPFKASFFFYYPDPYGLICDNWSTANAEVCLDYAGTEIPRDLRHSLSYALHMLFSMYCLNFFIFRFHTHTHFDHPLNPFYLFMSAHFWFSSLFFFFFFFYLNSNSFMSLSYMQTGWQDLDRYLIDFPINAHYHGSGICLYPLGPRAACCHGDWDFITSWPLTWTDKEKKAKERETRRKTYARRQEKDRLLESAEDRLDHLSCNSGIEGDKLDCFDEFMGFSGLLFQIVATNDEAYNCLWMSLHDATLRFVLWN